MLSYFALALMLSGATETAVTNTGAATSEAAAEQPAAKKKKPKKICKENEASTGSRIAKRICKTEEEWAVGEDGQEIGTKSKGGAITN
jgi:hypothetical protein